MFSRFFRFNLIFFSGKGGFKFNRWPFFFVSPIFQTPLGPKEPPPKHGGIRHLPFPFQGSLECSSTASCQCRAETRVVKEFDRSVNKDPLLHPHGEGVFLGNPKNSVWEDWGNLREPSWWFQTFFIFTLIPTGNDPIWRSYFFRWVGSTTN